EDYCEEALAIARAVGDEHLVADLLYQHAFLFLHQGKKNPAVPLIESGLGLAHRLHEAQLTGRMLTARSYAAYLEGTSRARPAMRSRPCGCSVSRVPRSRWVCCWATSDPSSCRQATWTPPAATWPRRSISSACSTTALASSTRLSTSAWPSTSAARRTRPGLCSRNLSNWPGAWGQSGQPPTRCSVWLWPAAAAPRPAGAAR